eukprot:m.114261 g.114261  ORF g.114261 m.114261 type:complete len:78 (+) comp51893_c0_seq6:457-690(+)
MHFALSLAYFPAFRISERAGHIDLPRKRRTSTHATGYSMKSENFCLSWPEPQRNINTLRVHWADAVVPVSRKKETRI